MDSGEKGTEAKEKEEAEEEETMKHIDLTCLKVTRVVCPLPRHAILWLAVR